MTARRLTLGQQRFLEAVKASTREQFHISVVDACLAMGLVRLVGNDTMMLVGRNSYSASAFQLVPEEATR